jgi:hypothetical protein
VIPILCKVDQISPFALNFGHINFFFPSIKDSPRTYIITVVSYSNSVDEKFLMKVLELLLVEYTESCLAKFEVERLI